MLAGKQPAKNQSSRGSPMSMSAGRYPNKGSRMQLKNQHPRSSFYKELTAAWQTSSLPISPEENSQDLPSSSEPGLVWPCLMLPTYPDVLRGGSSQNQVGSSSKQELIYFNDSNSEKLTKLTTRSRLKKRDRLRKSDCSPFMVKWYWLLNSALSA